MKIINYFIIILVLNVYATFAFSIKIYGDSILGKGKYNVTDNFLESNKDFKLEYYKNSLNLLNTYFNISGSIDLDFVMDNNGSSKNILISKVINIDSLSLISIENIIKKWSYPHLRTDYEQYEIKCNYFFGNKIEINDLKEKISEMNNARILKKTFLGVGIGATAVGVSVLLYYILFGIFSIFSWYFGGFS